MRENNNQSVPHGGERGASVPGPEKLLRVERISPYDLAIFLVILDMVCIVAAGFVPLALLPNIPPALHSHYALIILCSAVWNVVVSHVSVRAYHPSKMLTGAEVLWRGLSGALATFATILLVGALTKTTDVFSRAWFIAWAVGSYGCIGCCRALVFAYIESKLARGACVTRALLVTIGTGQLDGPSLATKTQNRVRALAHVHLSTSADLDALAQLVSSYRLDAVIIEAPWNDVPAAGEAARQALRDFAVDINIVPNTDAPGEILRLDRLGSRPMFQLLSHPMTRWNASLKRLEDVTVAILALILLAPIMVLIAVAIKLETPGPILFRQLRRGFNGQLIEVWKFRSMYAHTADLHALQQTSRDDARVTRVGRLIRRSSLDEMPQIFNVLQGTMSIVGPRPHALRTTAGGLALDEAADRYMARHRVKPGITGWAQVNGLRGELDSADKLRRRVDYDMDYITRWSLSFDFKIIVMTCLLMLYDRRAY